MRYSRQREAVYNAVAGTKCHPDAEWVYARVRESIPDVSLGTVYRNLRQLAEDRKLLTLETEKKTLRFDADLSPHSHFICKKCGCISDLYVTSEISRDLAQAGYRVDNEKTVLYGLCPICAAKREKK